MKKSFALLFFSFLIVTFFLSADQPNDQSLKRQTICLNMIVKDESKVIKRCLASVKKTIDYWVIVDTGSTDGTQQIIKEFMKDVPGELHERPWVNFGHNRNEALQLAKNKGDYLLFIDADEFLAFTDNFQMPKLDKDCYRIEVKEPNGTIFRRTFLINNSLNWHWEGVLHEDISCSEVQSYYLMSDVINYTMYDGHRSEDPQKTLKDAQALEKELEKNPQDSRLVFYVGQTYFSAEDFLKALKFFEKRVLMGGWDEEVFWSLYMIARSYEKLNRPQEVVVDSYCKAFNFRPSRVEPLYRLGRYYNKINNPNLAYIILSYALTIPLSNDSVLVEKWINEYGIQFEIYSAFYSMERYQESYDGFKKILSMKDLPSGVKKLTEDNLKTIADKLYPLGNTK
ncbi:MAG: glycosyltransferase [Chlamydiae bacterium]|nr:glycosyltransferase [Chlamydiota bacterium]